MKWRCRGYKTSALLFHNKDSETVLLDGSISSIVTEFAEIDSLPCVEIKPILVIGIMFGSMDISRFI